MGKVKQLISEIETCSDCSGLGYNGWLSPDGDYDFEFCACNPHELIQGEDF